MANHGKRYKLNALEAYIFAGIVREFGGLSHSNSLDKSSIEDLSKESNFDSDTLWKYCGLDTKNIGVTRKTLDKYVDQFSKGKFKSWGQLQSLINRTIPNRDVPYGHILPRDTYESIVSQGNIFLKEIFPNLKDDAYFNNVQPSIFSDSFSNNLNQYLDTLWYAYFYYPYGESYGQIIRTIIHIGESPEKVKSISPNNPLLDDFSGTVSFDKSEMVLNYNMTTKVSGKRGLHIKQYVHGGDSLPQVTLGEYLNIGNGGIGLHNIRVIMELKETDCKSLEGHDPKIYNERDVEFKSLPESYKRYLRFQKDNYREISTRGTYTLKDLDKVVLQEKKTRFYNKDVRLKEKFQVYLSFPRYRVSEEEYDRYHSLFSSLKDFWEEKYPIEIMSYCLTKPTSDRADSFHYISDMILDSDIFVGFFYKNSSISLSEIAIATEQGKQTFGFYSEDEKFNPEIFTGDWPDHVTMFGSYDLLEDALDYLKSDDFRVKHLAKYIKHYDDLTD